MKNRIASTFAKTKAAGRPAFIAYLTMGYPTLAASEEAADTLLANGADILELGVPFSDPVADGAVIRTAAYAALEQGVTLADILALAGRLRAKHPDAPLVVFSYYNVIYSYGLEKFAATNCSRCYVRTASPSCRSSRPPRRLSAPSRRRRDWRTASST